MPHPFLFFTFLSFKFRNGDMTTMTIDDDDDDDDDDGRDTYKLFTRFE